MMEKRAKTILITGGAKRIGRALVEHFSKNGWHTIVHYHTSLDEAQTLERDLKNCSLIQADLSKEEEVQSIFPRILERHGVVDCLINNASFFEYDDVNTTSRQNWDAHMETNLRAPFVLSQAFARQNLDRGNIINIIDQRVWNLTQYFNSYTISKYGLWGLTQTLALALAPRIRVNGIGPGPVLPNTRQTPDSFQRQYERTPLKRPIGLEELCNTAQYIIETPSLTGQMIALDGGSHLGWTFPETHHGLDE